MKVKRIIKGFIYLLPVIYVLVGCLAGIVAKNNDNLIYMRREDVAGNNTTAKNYIYTSDDSLTYFPFFYGVVNFNYFCDDVAGDLKNEVYNILSYFQLEDNEGTTYSFFVNFVSYEIIAIMVCAVFDVIFLIPEFYNKLEDKYIRGGKKRE